MKHHLQDGTATLGGILATGAAETINGQHPFTKTIAGLSIVLLCIRIAVGLRDLFGPSKKDRDADSE